MKNLLEFIIEKKDDIAVQVPVNELYTMLIKACKKARAEWLADKEQSATYWKNFEGESSWYWQNYLKEKNMFDSNCDEIKVTPEGCKLLACFTRIDKGSNVYYNGKDFNKYCIDKGKDIQKLFNDNINDTCEVLRTYEYESKKKWYDIIFKLNDTKLIVNFIGAVKELSKYVKK